MCPPTMLAPKLTMKLSTAAAHQARQESRPIPVVFPALAVLVRQDLTQTQQCTSIAVRLATPILQAEAVMSTVVCTAG